MQFYRSIWPVLALSLLLMAACAPVPLSPATEPPGSPSPEGPTSSPTRETPLPEPVGTPTRRPPGITGEEDLPEAVENALAIFNQMLESPAGEVTVISYEEVTWTDSCLGLGRPDESCLQALTPGYLIKVEVDGKPVEVHTDASGSNVRTKGEEVPVIVLPGAEQPLAVLAALRSMSDSLNIPVGQIEIVSAEEIEWPNSCLELPGPEEMCAEVITPGYLIILLVDGTEYEFHTDRSGENIRQK